MCRQGQSGAVEHTVLPGSHNGRIVRFEQLADGRIVSASSDGTLKIRSLNGPAEGPSAQVSTLRSNGSPITDMVVFEDGRCITSAHDASLTLWDLSQPAQERCITTLANTPRTAVKLHRLTGSTLLAESGPNVLLVCELSYIGALCSTPLDPDWLSRLPANRDRVGTEEPYKLPANLAWNRTLTQETFRLMILPDSRVVVRHPFDMRLCDLSKSPNQLKRVCIRATNHDRGITIQMPVCPVGVAPQPRVDKVKSVNPLPDGRLVHVARDGTILAYNPDNPDNVKGVVLGNLFSSLPAEHNMKSQYANHDRTIAWSTVMDDGRLLAACEVPKTVNGHGKTLFFVCDPYSTPQKPEPPPQEESPYACRIV